MNHSYFSPGPAAPTRGPATPASADRTESRIRAGKPWRSALLALALAATGASAEVQTDAATDRLLQQIAQAAQAGDTPAMLRAEKSLEVLARKGNPGAMWNLASYHHFDLPGKPPNEAKKCEWTLKSARKNVAEAYPGAYMCGKDKGKDAMDSFVNHQLPWARKMVQEGDDNDKAAAQPALDAYAQMQREKSRPATVGQLLERLDELEKKLK